MSIRLGVYDFLSYFIPGCIFLSTIYFILQKHQIYIVNLKDISIVESLLLGFSAFIMGHIFDAIASSTWWPLFHGKDFPTKTLIEFNKINPTIEITAQKIDYYTFLAYVRQHSIGMAEHSEQINATSIMLKNSSFGLFVFAVILGIEFFVDLYRPVYLLFAALCLIGSVILGYRAAKYKTWFYQSINQATGALVAKTEDFPIKFKPQKDNKLE